MRRSIAAFILGSTIVLSLLLSLFLYLFVQNWCPKLCLILLFSCEGNGRGGGDFRGHDDDKVGLWARDIISVEREPPAGFQEFVVDFHE